MKSKPILAVFLFAMIVFGWSPAHADQFPKNVDFENLVTFSLTVEGLTGDKNGNLYTAGRNPGVGNPCPVWRVNFGNPVPVIVGFIPAPATGQCSPSGLAFNKAGDLFVAVGSEVFSFTPNAVTPPTATVFAGGVPGTNGLAFDRHGNLWTGDGTTGQGRVWKITPAGVVTLEFRVQPMANEVNLVGGVGGVGRDHRTLPPGTITVTPTSRSAQNTAGSQPLVANGLAFDKDGDLLIADTARGAIWKVKFKKNGQIADNQVNCDTTFALNTLCLSTILVAHPLLEGTDGIALDQAGNIWNSVNERNAMVVVTKQNEVIEIFRNQPDATTQLRNGGPLEFPASPFLLGKHLCTSNSDGNRRDNSPSTAGNLGGAGQPLGSIACMDEELKVPGLPLPVK